MDVLSNREADSGRSFLFVGRAPLAHYANARIIIELQFCRKRKLFTTTHQSRPAVHTLFEGMVNGGMFEKSMQILLLIFHISKCSTPSLSIPIAP